MLESFQNEDSISSHLNPFQYDENLLDLEDQLKEEFWKIVKTLLTPRQREVIELYADGYTQMEIAKILGVNQSSVTKSINGNVDYSIDEQSTDESCGKKTKRVYGGTKKKLQKIISGDSKIKEILDRMAEIRTSKW
jgi:DNA-binding CsgD family transcriptional regulator